MACVKGARATDGKTRDGKPGRMRTKFNGTKDGSDGYKVMDVQGKDIIGPKETLECERSHHVINYRQ